MKNLIRTVAATALSLAICTQAITAAPIDPKSECKNNTCETFRAGMYRVKNTMTMNLLLEKQKGERVVVRLLSENGKVLHNEYLPKSQTKYGRKLNFSEMKDGDYILEISGDREKIVKNIRLGSDDVREVRRTLITMN
ncbi:hypothetical protein [Dyadobacter sandarakinus]|uniref:Por secretion system C-terminal sorting domain-containing protein n=1 Tax=Dyadobacter sandarakinus TaxID=2747268 RepID=A0ABX7IAN7_9BACT|nr:hypothetical protein [Dyadobacter sandarakinus]QRR02016.1 hypothetical protein HWI92_14420 [Dyadobacter sandarakinus]